MLAAATSEDQVESGRRRRPRAPPLPPAHPSRAASVVFGPGERETASIEVAAAAAGLPAASCSADADRPSVLIRSERETSAGTSSNVETTRRAASVSSRDQGRWRAHCSGDGSARMQGTDTNEDAVVQTDRNNRTMVTKDPWTVIKQLL